LLEQYINRCVASFKGKRKKCLVLDLDNTLWGGVVGEAGIEGLNFRITRKVPDIRIFKGNSRK